MDRGDCWATVHVISKSRRQHCNSARTHGNAKIKKWNVLLGQMREASHSLLREQDQLKNRRKGIRKEAGNTGVR